MVKKFFVSNYKKCWKFFIESRWYVVFALGIFCLTFLIGFAYPVFFREEIFSFIAELIESLEGKSAFELVGFIFLNNLKASFFAFVTGVAFGVLPFVIAVVNGYLVGFVSRETAMVEGICVLWQLAPHGIFELPAIIFSIGIGLKLGMSWLMVGGGWKRVKRDFVEGFRFFVFVIFPLLLIAGIIEGILVGVVS
jgi:stage II sporulation protein M